MVVIVRNTLTNDALKTMTMNFSNTFGIIGNYGGGEISTEKTIVYWQI